MQLSSATQTCTRLHLGFLKSLAGLCFHGDTESLINRGPGPDYQCCRAIMVAKALLCAPVRFNKICAMSYHISLLCSQLKTKTDAQRQSMTGPSHE
jgi:hypothetical protein